MLDDSAVLAFYTPLHSRRTPCYVAAGAESVPSSLALLVLTPTCFSLQ